MLKGLNSRTIKTQPQHQTIASYSSRADRQSAQTNSQSDLHQQTQITLASRAWRKIKYESHVTNFQTNESDRYKIQRTINGLSLARKKRCNQYSNQYELTSSNVGLKVRRSVQKDFKFSNNYTRDQIMHFFDASFPCKISKVINSSSSTSFTELDRTKYSSPKYFQNTAMFCTKEERPKSQINGWQVQQSNCSQNPAYQQISNRPSLPENTSNRSSYYSPADEQSGQSCIEDMELREYSIDIVTPSQLTPSNPDISLRIISDQQNHVQKERITKSRPIVQSHPNIVRESINAKTSQSIKPKKLSIKSINTKKAQEKSGIKQNVQVIYRNISKKQLSNNRSQKKTTNKITNDVIQQKQQVAYHLQQSKCPFNLALNEYNKSKTILVSKANNNAVYQKNPYTGIQSLQSDENLLDSIPAIRTLNSRIITNQPKIMPQNKVNIREPMYLDTGRSNLEETYPMQLITTLTSSDKNSQNQQSSTLIQLVREQAQKLMESIGMGLSCTKNEHQDIISQNIYQLQEYILSKTIKGY